MRPGTLASLALLLCLGTSPPAWSMAPGHAPPRTSFRGEFDPVVALTVVYGREPWNDLRGSMAGMAGSHWCAWALIDMACCIRSTKSARVVSRCGPA
jgi:hypothetical protein